MNGAQAGCRDPGAAEVTVGRSGREASGAGRSSGVSSGGPRWNEDPGGSNSKVG